MNGKTDNLTLSTKMLLSLADDLQAVELAVQKLKAKVAGLFKTTVKTAAIDEEIEYIDDPETIQSVKESLEAYRRGEYETLRTEKDIHNFVNEICT